jgi:translocation and assembly module TamB
MMLMVRLLKWILKAALGVVAILFVMALGVVLFVALTPVGGRVAADRISAIVSTPDRGISFTRPEGLLTGDLRIDALTLSDDMGPYAQIGGIKIDWSPTSLVTGVFRAEHISADTVNFIRAPRPPKAPATTQTTNSSGSPLPVGIRVAQIDLPDINLSQALSGRDFSLSVKGSIDATGPDISLDLQATRKDEPDAMASADVVYAPSENRLTLKAAVSEPQGGLLARVLRLPGTPAVELALDGEGPLSDWAGKLQGSVGGTPVISVDGKHILVENGRHRSGSDRRRAAFATLLPPAFRPLFGGTTDINIAASLRPIRPRRYRARRPGTSGAVKIAAKGAWDPDRRQQPHRQPCNGTNGPVDFVWPINGQESRFSFESINFTLTGAASSARFNATAALSAAQLPQGRFNQIRLQAESEDLEPHHPLGKHPQPLHGGPHAFHQ